MTDRQSSPKFSARLQEMLDALASRSDVDHAILELEGNGWQWAGASGKADGSGRPMEPEIPWFIASIDKLLTTVLVLQLHEDPAHELSIDDRLVDHLPAGITKGIHQLKGTDHTASITLRHLLSHGSGLPDYLEDKPRKGPALVDDLVSKGDRAFPLEELVAQVRRTEAHFAPRPVEQGGRKIRYNSTGFALLNAVLEARTGMGIEELQRERLFKPLGMYQTFFPGDGAFAAPAALRFGTSELNVPRFLRSISSMYSTGGDLIRFLRAIITGGVFQQKHTRELMTGTWNNFGFPTDRATLRSPSWPIQCALGLQRFKIPRWAPPFRNIPEVLGHTGSTGSFLFHCPELDLYMAGTVDQGTAGAVPYRLVPKVLDLLRKEGE